MESLGLQLLHIETAAEGTSQLMLQVTKVPSSFSVIKKRKIEFGHYRSRFWYEVIHL